MENKPYILVEKCIELNSSIPLIFGLANGYKVVAMIRESTKEEVFSVSVYDPNEFPVSFKSGNTVRYSTLHKLIEIILWADHIQVKMDTPNECI